MKSYNKQMQKPKIKLQAIINRLIKTPILYEDFLEFLGTCSENFFETPELELELLISNGLPLDFDGEYIYLKTTKTPIKEQVFCVVDIETNGASVKKGYQIIELGAVKYKNKEIIDKFESLVYAKDIPEYIQEVTSITPSMLVNAPVIDEVLKEFKIFLGDDVFVAHDIKFDYNFISDSFEKYDLGALKNRKLCTIDLAQRTILAQRYGLSYLKEQLNINIENHHRAYYDALSTAKILEICLENITNQRIKSVENLISFSKNNKILKQKED